MECAVRKEGGEERLERNRLEPAALIKWVLAVALNCYLLGENRHDELRLYRFLLLQRKEFF